MFFLNVVSVFETFSCRWASWINVIKIMLYYMLYIIHNHNHNRLKIFYFINLNTSFSKYCTPFIYLSIKIYLLSRIDARIVARPLLAHHYRQVQCFSHSKLLQSLYFFIYDFSKRYHLNYCRWNIYRGGITILICSKTENSLPINSIWKD